ncbi:MAG TPA: hypothetical protein PLO41_25605 [Rubrivivax sp.]|nr:hypothetical protein [Rubrivivax sp.]
MPTLRHRPACALWALSLLAVSHPSAARADSTERQFWPEFNAYIRIDDRRRLMLAAAATRARESDTDNGQRSIQDVQLTVNFDYTLPPLLQGDMPSAEWIAQRRLWTRLGFEYGRSVGSASSDFTSYTGIAELNARHALDASAWLTGRVRVDLRDINGEPSQRYRLRAGAEWSTSAFAHPIDPYGSIEFVYDTRYSQWSRLVLKAGLETPIATGWRLEPYVELQLNRPDDDLTRVLGLGLTLKAHFH